MKNAINAEKEFNALYKSLSGFNEHNMPIVRISEPFKKKELVLDCHKKEDLKRLYFFYYKETEMMGFDMEHTVQRFIENFVQNDIFVSIIAYAVIQEMFEIIK